MANLIPESLSDMNRLEDMASLSSSYSTDDTDLFISLINACSRFILNNIRRSSLKYRTVTNEIHNGHNSSHVLTNYTPIISVTSLYSDSNHDFTSATEVDADDFFIENGEAGIIRLKDSLFTNALYSIKISYVAGYSLFHVDDYDLVFNEGGSDLTATISAGNYNADDLATEIQTQLNSTGSDTHTVSYSETIHKLDFSSDGATLEFKWTSSTDLAYVIGVDTSTDDTGSTSYSTDYPLLGIPEDLITACNQIVRWLHSEIIENRMGKFSDGDYSFDFSNIPMYILEMLQQYRRITK